MYTKAIAVTNEQEKLVQTVIAKIQGTDIDKQRLLLACMILNK